MTEIKTECKPNLSLSGFWFTFTVCSARLSYIASGR